MIFFHQRHAHTLFYIKEKGKCFPRTTYVYYIKVVLGYASVIIIFNRVDVCDETTEIQLFALS